METGKALPKVPDAAFVVDFPIPALALRANAEVEDLLLQGGDEGGFELGELR